MAAIEELPYRSMTRKIGDTWFSQLGIAFFFLYFCRNLSFIYFIYWRDRKVDLEKRDQSLREHDSVVAVVERQGVFLTNYIMIKKG